MTESDRRLGALEWRLYLVAALAGLYVLTWRVLDRPTVTARTPVASPSPQPRARWLDELPADRRPQVTPPSGWTIATRVPTTSASPDPRLVRVPTKRARTRSS